MNKCLIISILIMICGNSVDAQDDRLDKLSMDELLSVKMSTSSLPLQIDNDRLTKDWINIGLIVPMSKFPDFSQELINAAQLAMDQINVSGGVLEKKLSIIMADDAADLQTCLKKVDTLINQYNVNYLIGPTNSERAIAISKEINKDDLTLISPSASAVEISMLNDNRVFRTSSSDVLPAYTVAKYVTQKLGKQKAAIFYINNEYGKGLKDEFSQNFKFQGGEVVGSDYYSSLVDLTQYNVAEKVAGLLDLSPDVLFLISSNVDLDVMAVNLSDLPLLKNHEVILISTDAAKGEYSDEAKKLYEGMIGVSPSFTSDDYFLKSYSDKYGKAPSFFETADTYDIVYLYAGLFLSESKSPEKATHEHLIALTNEGKTFSAEQWKSLKGSINKGKDVNFQGASGTIEFNNKGDIISREMEVWKYESGAFIRIQ